MLPPLMRRPRRGAALHSRERGVTLALVAVAIFSIIAMAALSIDVSTLYQASAEAQRSADAAALAAASALSSSGMTGDPANSASTWAATCENATQLAQDVANHNNVGGAPPTTVSVTFLANDGSDCASSVASGFGVNPIVTVKVTQSSLSTYFSRIWGRTGSSVSATATAEAFNPSNSKTYSGEVVPVQPRCVKPWVVPNYQPWFPANVYSCNTTTCPAFVDPSGGTINNAGIAFNNAKYVIGQTFVLTAACKYKGSTCVLGRGPKNNPQPTRPEANVPNGGGTHIPAPPNLEYLPGETLYPSAAVPSDGSNACSAVSDNYAQAIAGCDQSTRYQCGVQNMNNVDLSANPGQNDTPNGVQCLIHAGNGSTGQDTLQLNGANPSVALYPFQIQAGSNNPLVNGKVATSGDYITTSTSIVSLPIFDSDAVQTFKADNTTQVTVIGFLQVFINSVDNSGNVSVTVMNVAGCGNAATGTALSGTSPVPVRLITPP
jgi:Flp pilus assembly protein TadG